MKSETEIREMMQKAQDKADAIPQEDESRNKEVYETVANALGWALGEDDGFLMKDTELA